MEKVKMYLILAGVFLFLLVACEEKVLFDLDEQLAIELTEIDNFLSRNGIATENLENQARLNVVAQGNGRIPQDLDIVKYFFAIYDLDSTLLVSNRQEFSSISDQFLFIPDTLSFKAYTGWSEYELISYETLGVSLSQEKSLIQLFMPSYIVRNIPALSGKGPVMMDFEVVEVLR